MPKYTYECLSCDAVFEYRHGMEDRLKKCMKCESESLEKRVSDFSLGATKEGSSEKPVGSEVKKFIEQTREEIKEEREDLSSRVIK